MNFRYSRARYRLQYQPRRMPGDDLVRAEPIVGNDKWATVADNLTATQAVARLMGAGALSGNRERIISDVHSKRGSSPVMDDMYFYRIVPVDPFHMIVEDDEVAA